MIELSLIYIFNLASLLLVGVASIYGAKTVKHLYDHEFSTAMHWLLIIIESIFLIQLIIFLALYFNLNETVSTLFVLVTTIFIAFLFFFATYKIIQFLEKYSFYSTELSEKEINFLKNLKGTGKKKN